MSENKKYKFLAELLSRFFLFFIIIIVFFLIIFLLSSSIRHFQKGKGFKPKCSWEKGKGKRQKAKERGKRRTRRRMKRRKRQRKQKLRINPAKIKYYKIIWILEDSKYAKELIEDRRLKIKYNPNIVKFLSKKDIKVILNRLLQRNPTNPKWKWGCRIDEDHFINYCCKTKKWIKRNKGSEKTFSLIIWGTIMSWKGGPIQEWIQF